MLVINFEKYIFLTNNKTDQKENSAAYVKSLTGFFPSLFSTFIFPQCTNFCHNNPETDLNNNKQMVSSVYEMETAMGRSVSIKAFAYRLFTAGDKQNTSQLCDVHLAGFMLSRLVIPI